jgi:hypothetical protein
MERVLPSPEDFRSMRPGLLALRLTLCAALVCPGLVPVTAGAGTQSAPDSPLDPAESTVEIRLQADGDALVRVSTTFRIESSEEAAAFDSLASAFTADGSDVGFSVAPFRRAAAAAENATGREMAIRDVERTVNRTNDSGVRRGTLALSFRWTEFGRVEGDRLYVDDAFNTTDGTWLPRLDRGQKLIVRPPPNYLVEDAPFPVRDGTISETGSRTFAPGTLAFTFRQINPTSTTTTTTTTTNATSDPGPVTVTTADPERQNVVPLIGGILIAIAAVGLGLYAASRREDGSGSADGDGDGTDASGGASAETTGTAEATETPAAPAGAATIDGNGSDTDSGPESVNETLLSDEERVERLLERNGGRMKQANIVDETGWSNAKVSQLLSSMAEEDRVDKLRIGRENLISLPEDEDGSEVPD